MLFRSILIRASATLAVAAAVPLLLGATDQLQEALSRLREMSPDQRAKAADALRRFDLRPPDEQKAIRQLDQRINGLPPSERQRYLDVLRRYHVWLETLPETVRDGLLLKAPDQRMPEIQSLVAKYPVPQERTPAWIQFTDLTGTSDLELAALFKIWHDLTQRERQEIENQTALSKRREMLLDHAIQKKLLRELRPAGFRPEEWIPKVESKIAEIRSFDPELKDTIAKVEKRLEELAKDKQRNRIRVRDPILRRLAINLYTLSRDPPRSVPADRLDGFLAAMPPWVRTQFEAYPADEARRRLTSIYRLVYPYPQEFEPSAPAVQGDAARAKGPSPGPVVPVAPGPPRKGPALPKTPPKPAQSPF